MVTGGDDSLDSDREYIHTAVATLKRQALGSIMPLSSSQTTSPARGYSKARAQGLDGDKLFDLPEEPLVPSPAPRGRKRKMATTFNTRQSRKSSTTLTSQHCFESGGPQSKTLPASEKLSDNLPNSKQLELFPNARIGKTIGAKPFRSEVSFNATNIVITESTIEKLSTFRFQAQQPKSLHSPDSGSDPFTSHLTPPAVHERLGGYDSSSIRKRPLNKLPPVRNDTFTSDIIRHRNTQDVFRDVCLSNYQSDSNLVGSQDSSITMPTDITDMLLDSSDEFPMNSEDELEMAQLPLLGRVTNNNIPKASHLPASARSQLQREEIDDGYHELSTPNSGTLYGDHAAMGSISAEKMPISDTCSMLIDGKECSSIRSELHEISTSLWNCRPCMTISPKTSKRELPASISSEYMPLPIFARPNFPSRVLDRSPIDGVSASPFSRICFRIGEIVREGRYWDGLGQDTLIELFARVRSSSREAGISKQIFQFADLFHDHPPFPNGVLENCKAYGLQEMESRQLLGPEGMGQMVRCIGRWKKVPVGAPGWMFHILNIRATDWEEVRWTKEIVGAKVANQGPIA